MNGRPRKWFRFRIATMLALFLALFCALVFRAFHLQIMTGKTYKTLAEKQHRKTLQLYPERGIIYDRNGEKLAASILADSVFADPSKIDNADEAAAQLAAVTGQPRKAIAQQISRSKNFCWVARMITPAQSEQIRNLKMEGIYLIQEPKRFYPNRELAGQLIGFVGMDSNGLEGLEMRYDGYLRGEPEKILWGRDARGKKLYMPERSVTGKKDEQLSLVLTLDSRIQHAVESNLKEAVLRTRARGGFIIVMDPRTGEILAMANNPVFNPNAYASAAADNKRNKAITDCFDPGSTFKPFLVAAAIEEGVVKESDRFYCENGAYRVANATFHEANRKRHGVLTVREILKYSSNIGSVKISEKLGREKFHGYIRNFGFGQKTNIELPGEIAGLLRPWQNWTQVDTSTVAFGQGVSVTAIQLVSALSAIANGGLLMQPHIVKKFVDSSGETVREFAPTPVRRVISAETARRMTAMLTNVVGEQGGTGKNAALVNVDVAGKTGTAQKFDFAHKRFSSERVRTSFMGFFPSENPRFVMLVSIDEPQLHKWGGEAAAPVFRSISQQLIRCFEHDIGETPPVREKEINAGARIQLVSTPAAIPATGAAEEEEAAMPDFRGMTVRQALKAAQDRGLTMNVTGSGWAVSQRPAAGSPLKGHRSCTVSFSTGD
ncbi:MAG TPA: penicillin-binding protein [Syntrophales bacterium]|nr:penicillin-binding protein [Syntrophales bacterium]